MSGGTTSTNTVQNSDPWSGAQPYLTDLMSQAQSLYNKGSSYAPFSTYAPPSPTTTLGLQLTQDRALNGSPTMTAANNSLQQLMKAQTAPGSSTLQSLLSGYSDPGSALTKQGGTMQNGAIPLASQMASANPNGNPASQYLSSEAATTAINPYLDSMFSAASKPVINAVNSQFSLGGRTGSAANQSVLTQDLGNMASQMYGQNYQNAIQNQQNAANSIQSAYDNGANRNLNATSLLGNLYDNQAQRLLSSGSQLSSDALAQANMKSNAANNLNSQFNTQNQQRLAATALTPTLANQDYTDLQNLLNVGGAYDTQANNQIQDLLTRYNYGQQQPANLLSQYAGIVNGMGGLGGTTNSTSKVPNNNTTSLIGGGLGLLGSALPFILGGGGAAGGATAGGMAALGALAMSDRYVKTDIKRIGTYPNGLPKYSFRYRGSDETHIGLMADEVEAMNPKAVCTTPLGFKAVYYDLALAA